MTDIEIERMEADTRKLRAETAKLLAEYEKLAAERLKLAAEADLFSRQRLLTLIMIIVSATMVSTTAAFLILRIFGVF